MGYKVNPDGFDGQDMEVVISFWTGPKLLINGKKAETGPKRGQMMLKRNDGKEVVAMFKQKMFGSDVPMLEVDGKSIELAKPLTWQQWIFVGSPAVILFFGGALGAVLAMLGLYLNLKLFRSELNNVLKYILCIVVTLSFMIGYLFLSAIIILLFSN
jgi:hypothetical protein